MIVESENNEVVSEGLSENYREENRGGHDH
jgi:hypothetical protein